MVLVGGGACVGHVHTGKALARMLSAWQASVAEMRASSAIRMKRMARKVRFTGNPFIKE
jgi:hypothetical protein